ncbi:MAG: response regulator [Nitrospira sp.]|jgi:HD-like signal output (HDOD) protein|nr:response regulator [Nitrospira sp.]
MKTVLFVDENPASLEMVRQALAPLAGQWEILMAGTVDAALAVFARRPVDVLVSDSHLSGMGGLRLQAEIRARYPGVMRVVCSNAVHRDSMLHGLDVAHQFIAKPFDAAGLGHMLNGLSLLQNRLNNQSLREFISTIAILPSMPMLYQEFVLAMESPHATAETAGRIIAKDMAMLSKVLQIVNSMYYGLRRTISNPAQAVALLGVNTVKSLILASHVFSELSVARRSSVSLEGLWRHSIETATHARAIAQAEGRGSMGVERAFMAGLLHDIGVLVLVSNFPDGYGKVMKLVKAERIPICEAERAVFQATHPDVGGLLLSLWGVNDALVDAVVFHHEPAGSLQKGFSTLAAVHVANAIDEVQDPAITGGVVTAIDDAYLQACGLGKRKADWEGICGASERNNLERTA